MVKSDIITCKPAKSNGTQGGEINKGMMRLLPPLPISYLEEKRKYWFRPGHSYLRLQTLQKRPITMINTLFLNLEKPLFTLSLTNDLKYIQPKLKSNFYRTG